MRFHSIRSQLQLWYGILLFLILAGFGITTYQLQRGKQFRRIDEGLQRRAGELASVLRGPRPRERIPPGPRPPDLPEGFSPEGGRTRPEPRLDEPLEGSFGGTAPLARGLADFRLPPLHPGFSDQTDSAGVYFVVWGRDGRELSRSTNAPADLAEPPKNLPRGPHPPQSRGNSREALLAMPPGEIIIVGRSIQPELNELRRTALGLAGTGGVILVLGLAGGWWIAGRAIRPIAHISATAAKIATGDLSQRINTDSTENELSRLAGVLNSAFARLETAFEQQSQFTSDAAHELRTPVTVLLTQTQAALAKERSAVEYRQTLEACLRSAQRMRRLIESLLELARFDAGQEVIKRVRFDLSQIVSNAIELLEPLAAERGVTLLAEVPSLECVGDPERVGQAITNVITNAIYYNKENGVVRIRAERQSGVISIIVSDTGPGIAPEILPHLFKRFVRADQSRSTGGSGLGLSICRAIVEAHGGRIEAISKLGEGSTFTIHLPQPA